MGEGSADLFLKYKHGVCLKYCITSALNRPFLYWITSGCCVIKWALSPSEDSSTFIFTSYLVKIIGLGDLEAEWKGWCGEIFREWRKERVC